MHEVTDALADHYNQLESDLDVRSNPDYGQLVVPNGNAREPVHRWFHLKEAFSCELLPRVLKDLTDLDSRELRVLDPFSGAGTTAASLLRMVTIGDLDRATVYGLETNPFLHLVASSKLRAFTEPRPSVLSLARHVAARALTDGRQIDIPGLSTFSDTRYFDPDRLQILLRLRNSIDDLLPDGSQNLTRDLLRVALGSTVEAVANLRRDGRALRYTKKHLNQHPVDIFLARCEAIEEDLPTGRVRVSGKIFSGDGVAMEPIDGRFKPFDLVLFSPPYPNNIDYTEVYKLENWFLRFIDTPEEFRAHRLSTVHSHPSVSRPGRLPHGGLTEHENGVLRDLVAPVIDALPADRYQRGRREVLEGYVVDMYRTLRSARNRLRPGGHLIYVVGNSAHGLGDSQFVIAADLLMAASARLAGLDVGPLEVARQLHRRSCDSPFLRETVVFARRPSEDGQARTT